MSDSFDGTLVGFDKDARALVERALAKGWTGRMSRKGHAILRHPGGGTVAVSRNGVGRALANSSAEIARIESGAPGVWTVAGKSGHVMTDGQSFKCVECGLEGPTAPHINGHYVSRHTDARLKSAATRKARRNMPGRAKAEEPAAPPPVGLPEKDPALEKAIIDVVEAPPLTLDDWLGAMPAMLAKLAEDFMIVRKQRDDAQDEAARLREHLKTLASLAGEF